MRDGEQVRAFFGHHRCASQWILSILHEAADRLGLRVLRKHRSALEPDELIQAVRTNSVDVILAADVSFDRIEPAMPGMQAVHVARDPRDVAVSALYSHRNSHPTDNWPELTRYRKALSERDDADGLLYVIDYLSHMEVQGVEIDVLGAMAGWEYSQLRLLDLSFEELTASPRRGFDLIFCFWGWLERGGTRWLDSVKQGLPGLGRRSGVTQKWVEQVVERQSFENLSGGRTKGEADRAHHYRRGEPQNWKRHFGPEHVERFKEKYQYVLEDLGYEEDRSW